VISTVLRYVEAGAGLGIIPESLGEIEDSPRWMQLPLTPHLAVPLVMVWKDAHEEPSVAAFQKLVIEWLRTGKLWSQNG